MDGGRGMEQEYYEFEMLLGEIPDATFVNPRQSDTSATNNSLKLGTVPKEQVEQKSLHYGKYINSHNSPHHSKNDNKRTLFGSLSSSKGLFDQTAHSDGNVICDYSKLQDNCSLVSAFDDLSLKDGLATKPDTLTSVMHDSTSSFNQNFMSDKENALFNRFKFGMDCVGMPLSSSHVAQFGTIEMPTSSSLTIPNGCCLSDPDVEAYSTLTRTDGVRKFSAKMDIQDTSEFLMKKRPEDFPGSFQGPQQNLADYPGAMPVYPESHAFRLFSSVPSSRMELTSPAIQQQYYMNVESTAPHNCNQFNMDWQNPEGYHDEQIFYAPPYMQNQGLQVCQIPNGVVSCIRSSTGNHIQPYFRYPGRHQTQHLSGNSYGNDNFVHKGYNDFEALPKGDSSGQFPPQGLFRDENCYGVSHGQKLTSSDNLAYCTKDFLGSRFLDRTKICPEKILTRSDGVNSQATLRSSCARIDQTPPISDSSWMLYSDGHAEHPINGYFQLDGLNCRSSSPNNFDFVITPKASQMKYNSVDDIAGKIYSMAKDQIGCRFLQKKFTEGCPEDIEKIFYEIKSHIAELMTDPFGNYLVQKLLEVCNEDQRMCILRTLTRKMGELFRISCDMHGTRAVQRVIETVQTAEHYSMIVASLKPFVVALIKNVNGNHVAQRCLQHFPAEYREFVIDAAIAHCVEIATDRQGCCVLQKCLHHSDGGQKNRLMSEIAANSLALSQDQYGNYVVQFMLDQEVPWVTSNILHQLEGSYADLSMQKCSSNVVEKCLRLAGEETRIRIIQELMCSPVLPQILQDPFGNYVIQTVIKECKGALRAAVMEAIRPHFTELRSSPFGKKVLSTILRK